MVGNERGLEDKLAAIFDRTVDAKDAHDAAQSVGLEIADRCTAGIDERAFGKRGIVDRVAAGKMIDALRMREAHAHAGCRRAAEIRKRKVDANRFAWRDCAARLEHEGPKTLDQSGRSRREDPGQGRRCHVLPLLVQESQRLRDPVGTRAGVTREERVDQCPAAMPRERVRRGERDRLRRIVECILEQVL